MLELELSLHPRLEPVDLYKMLYQALYGPFHILRDPEHLKMSIESEIQTMQQAYQPDFQELGPVYSRLSLSMIKHDQDAEMNSLRIACLADWILDSCRKVEDVTQDFLRNWNGHKSLFREKLPASDELWLKAEQLANQGILPSHSELFHAHYHPHYRLIDHHLTNHKQIIMELIS